MSRLAKIGLAIALSICLGLSLLAWVYVQPVSVEDRNNFLDVLTKIVGGPLLLVSLILTWRNLAQTQRVASETLENARETLNATHDAQTADRFLRSVEQLGAKANVELRLGGIFSLERIARVSQEYYWPIMELMSGYLRSNARFELGPEGPTPTDMIASRDDHPEDIQAAVRILGRRIAPSGQPDPEALNLISVDLSNLHLEGLNFAGAIMWNSCLDGSVLCMADLRNARMTGAFLRQANLEGADLRSALLWGVKLDEATLKGARFEGADLSEVSGITVSDLREANIDDNTILPRTISKRDRERLLRRAHQESGEEPLRRGT